MGEYDGMDYTWAQHQYECEQNFKKQQRRDPDRDGYIKFDGKKFRSEKELDEYLDKEDKRIKEEIVRSNNKLLKGFFDYGMEDSSPSPLLADLSDEDFELYLHGAKQKRLKKKLSLKTPAGVVLTDSMVVLDGSNIIGADENLRVRVLVAIVSALKEAKYSFKIFVDKTIFGWLRKKQDDEGLQYLSESEKQGVVVVTPSRAEADGQILQLAEFEPNVHIVSNDRYRDYVKLHPWLLNKDSANRVHGINLVPMSDGRVRVLIAGFNLDIVV